MKRNLFSEIKEGFDTLKVERNVMLTEANKKLAEEFGMIIVSDDSHEDIAVKFSIEEYTALLSKVREDERERCAVCADEYNQAKLNTAMKIAKSIRSLK